MGLRGFDRCWKGLSLEERLVFGVEFRQKKFALKFSIA
jgi:hypothetical protein